MIFMGNDSSQQRPLLKKLNETSKKLIDAAQNLARQVKDLKFGPPVTHVYHPLEYAWESHAAYLASYGGTRKKVIFLGMNPGPFGMVQTGVPFGEINAVQNWLKVESPIGKPPREHPQRPVEGFACKRREISGQRLWGLFANRYPDARDFFADHFVANFCPLAFLEASGRNRTPDKLPASELAALLVACDEHLRKVIEVLQPDWVIGVGTFAEKRALRVLQGKAVKVDRILHPSPASPRANRDWAVSATRHLQALGIWK
jgi:single-strand selective monofunctional uracil DNA glycosylase